MSKPKEPGVIPAWAEDFKAISTSRKTLIALSMGVSLATLYNWAAGRTVPGVSEARDIVARIRKEKGGKA
jgi:hypothetical protein